jgi:DNA-binding beta-propeller fold protein YncE
MEARQGCRWRSWTALIGVGIVFVFLSWAGSARAASRIYWGDEGTASISSANLDNSGGGSNLATMGAPALSDPSGTAIDVATGTIYWVDQSTNKVSFAKLDGSGGGELNTTGATVDNLEGVAIDPAAGKLYWANTESPSAPISFAKLDGSGGGNLNLTGATPSEPSGLAIDTATGRVYWANFGNDTISFANLNGSGGGGQLNITGATADGPAGIAIDPTRGRIYWTNFDGDTISFANLNGTGGGGQLNTGQATITSPWGLAIDPAAGKVYWANLEGSPSLAFANLNGSGGDNLNTTPLTPGNPDFPALLEPPTGTGDPSLSGGSTMGSTLACSQGSWAPDQLGSFLYQAPRNFAYSWTLNGAPISSAASNSITAGSPGTYTCKVTASNAAGATVQSSAGFTVSQPPPPPPTIATLSGLRVSPVKFSLAGRKVKGSCVKPTSANRSKRHCQLAIKLKISYALNTAATVAVTFARQGAGRKVNGRCVKPTAKNRKHSRCTQMSAIHGRITKTGKAGPNSFVFNGKIGGHKLGAGTYRLTATPGGGAPRTVTFNLTG